MSINERNMGKVHYRVSLEEVHFEQNNAINYFYCILMPMYNHKLCVCYIDNIPQCGFFYYAALLSSRLETIIILLKNKLQKSV